ncbi:SpoIIE family protein phosphatase [Streptomyces sp. DSM 40712]|uniref:SpoIIE family protein phosphatase n=1 Tax=Streptomyces lancefieldiae TaxID=3075520 RepID=A0ABU3AQZ2_9ACTN|nr:SpoIIE family protein phosphatase [Streptomyces sp. DSM 40712]MDT0612623.1 SpoIIE family protein phosphatase [Streptomyces sp. DSM 40712]
MTSEHATPAGAGAAPDPAPLARVVAEQRAESDRLREPTATSAVVERAKGAVMALTGGSAEAAHETLTRRAEAKGRTLLEECRLTLGSLAPPPHGDLPDSGPAASGTTGSPDRPPAPPQSPALAPASRPSPDPATGTPGSPDPASAPPGLPGPATRPIGRAEPTRATPSAPARAAASASAAWESYEMAAGGARGPVDRQEQRLADLQRLGNLGWVNWNPVTGEAAWSAQVFAIFGRDPSHGPVRLTGLPELALPEDAAALDRAVRALVCEGRPCDVPFRARTPAGVRHLRMVAEAARDADGTPVEVHGFVQDLTARRRAELALVESERAMLTQHDVLRAERSLAARLQDALLPLPRRPVRRAGLRVEVAYLPAQSGVQVGGDWFSAIELPEGDALFVVGDVAGHGVDAVATMAQLRFTAKGMIITGSSLTGALVRLNTLLLHSGDAHGTASMVLARYEPTRRRLVWAQAGHLPPLLLRSGTARYLDRPRGMLLGASTTPVFTEAECFLEPGDRLVLYTDGLVERPTEGIDRGLDRLAETAAAHHRGSPGFLEPLLAAMLEEEDRRDDVCVLDIRVPDDDIRAPDDPAGPA